MKLRRLEEDEYRRHGGCLQETKARKTSCTAIVLDRYPYSAGFDSNVNAIMNSGETSGIFH